MVQNITDDSYYNDVVTSDKPVLLDTYADWCGPCRMLAPVVDAISEEMSEQVKFLKANIDNCPQITEKFQVAAVPTLLFFNNGQLVDRRSGLMNKDELVAWINMNLQK